MAPKKDPNQEAQEIAEKYARTGPSEELTRRVMDLPEGSFVIMQFGDGEPEGEYVPPKKKGK